MTSASLVFRAIHENMTFISHDPNEEFPEIFANEVFIVDVAVTQKTFESLKNIHANKVIWIDHHKPFVDISTLTVPENV